MYHGNYHSRVGKTGGKRAGALTIALVLVLALAVGGTLAYLFTRTDDVQNTFTPSYVTCQVTESFDGTTKRNVNVTNTGDIDAYLRVKLVTYRVNESGQRIGGTATIPPFTPGAGWVEHEGYYYYTKPVAPNKQPETALIGSIMLTSYDDADGGRQVIEVMAEAIQSVPAKAVGEAWGVTITENGVTTYPAGGGR